MSYLKNSYAITNSLRITINDHKFVILKTELSGSHLNDLPYCQVHLLHFINRARCGRNSCTFPFQSSCQMLANRSTIVNATIEMLSVFFFKSRPERIRWQQVGEIVRTTRGNSPSNSDRKRCQLIFCTISIDLSASWFFLAWSNGSRLKEWPRCWSRRFVGSAKWNELTIWCNCDFFVWLFVFWVFFFLFFVLLDFILSVAHALNEANSREMLIVLQRNPAIRTATATAANTKHEIENAKR